MPFISLSPVVAIDGTELDAVWSEAMREVRVESEYQVPARGEVRFVDTGFALLDNAQVKLGAEVKINARPPGAGSSDDVLLFSGEITSISSDVRKDAVPELALVAHDRSHRMARASTVKAYTNMTLSDVVSQLAQGYGLKASVTATNAVQQYLLQVDSDLGLLTELARRTGYDWWVADKVLHFERPDKGSAAEATLGEGLVAFSVRASGHHPDEVKVTGWDRAQQTEVVGQSSAPSGAVYSTAPLSDDAVNATVFGTAVLSSATLVPQTQGEAETLSQAVLDRAASSAVSARGTCVDLPQVAIGGSVRIGGVGQRLAGTYPVTRVEHVFRAGTPLTTRFRAGDRMPHSLVETLGAAGANRSPAFHHDGLVVGLVTNINDSEKMGRVKVKLPGVSNSEESWWARVVTAGGGQSRGNTFHPEVNDEVLVGFEGGDPRQPVVLGGLYGSRSTIPPLKISGSGLLEERTMTSRLGHTFSIVEGDDDTTKGGFDMKLKGGDTSMRLGGDGYTLAVPDGKPVKITAGNASITIADSGAITISSPGNLSIKATGDLSLEGANVKISGQAEVKIQGQAGASVQGTMLKLTGDAITEIKGGMVKIN